MSSGTNKFLQAARGKAGMTQLEAALKLGHQTAQYISNLERGLCEPSVEMSVKLCRIYKADMRSFRDFVVTKAAEQIRARLDKAIGSRH